MGKGRMRLDELLVRRGMAESRSRAKALIMSGKVRCGTEVLDKAGREYPEDIELHMVEPPRFVSRGGEKLAGYFSTYPWPIWGKRFLDLGASTGGFSDFLLQSGASEGTCVDVGYGQLHYKLQQDPRIRSLERVNARHLESVQLPYDIYPLVVMDLSFISLRLVLPVAWKFLAAGGLMVALIKPQFEVGREEADRNRGIITDPHVREQARDDILEFVRVNLAGSSLVGCCESPITGMSGNLEYLAGWTRIGAGHS